MKLNKWNYETHEYDPIEVPDEWNIPLYTDDMGKIVNCPQCGKELPYGETYTSKEIHNWVGLGYGVCEECYEKECERRNKYKAN